jgi:hypothetical protein
MLHQHLIISAPGYHTIFKRARMIFFDLFCFLLSSVFLFFGLFVVAIHSD